MEGRTLNRFQLIVYVATNKNRFGFIKNFITEQLESAISRSPTEGQLSPKTLIEILCAFGLAYLGFNTKEIEEKLIAVHQIIPPVKKQDRNIW